MGVKRNREQPENVKPVTLSPGIGEHSERLKRRKRDTVVLADVLELISWVLMVSADISTSEPLVC